MSDALVHSLIGDWLGETLTKIPDRRVNKPFLAAVLAFASHALLDRIDHEYTPDWVAWRADARRLQQDLPYLAAEITGLAAALASILQEPDKHTCQMRLAGLLGALAPDLIDGVYAYLHPEAWCQGKLLLPWHQAGKKLPKGLTREQGQGRAILLTLLRLRF